MTAATLDPKLVTHLDSRSTGAEAFRVLRTNLQFLAIDQPIKSLLVTSSVPSEGKTLNAANLAVAFAQAGQRVLLVDADLRRPTLHRLFGRERAWGGLTTLLAGRTRPQEIIQETEVPGLSLLTSGPVPPNPAEVLGSARMSEFLHDAREAYDMLIVDSPPVMAVADPCVLAPRLDGVALVVRVGAVARPQVLRAKAALSAVHARLLGVIVDGVQPRNGSDYYYYYYYGSRT